MILIGGVTGVFIEADAQTGWTPCGRCEFEQYADDEHLGDIGYCLFEVSGVVNGCSGNTGGGCATGTCSELRIE